MLPAKNTSVIWNLQPFQKFRVRGFKHRFGKSRNPCACHAKSIVSDLQIHHACQYLCTAPEPLRRPRILQRLETPAPATRNRFPNRSRATARRKFYGNECLKVPRAWQFLTILISESFSHHNVVQTVEFPKVLRRRQFFTILIYKITWCKFCGAQFEKKIRTQILISKSFSHRNLVQILTRSWATDPLYLLVFRT